MKPLLVGELNPYGTRPEFALYPLPHRATGDRLCTLIMGLRRKQYLEMFDRANLCIGRWSVRKARLEVNRLVGTKPTIIVILGSKVCKAFGIEFIPFTKIDYIAPGMPKSIPLITLPHPSGLCRIWNDDGAFDRARKVLMDNGVIPVSVQDTKRTEAQDEATRKHFNPPVHSPGWWGKRR